MYYLSCRHRRCFSYTSFRYSSCFDHLKADTTTPKEPTLVHLQDCTKTASDLEREAIALDDDDPSQDRSWAEAEKGLVRKLDTTLLPMTWVLYMFNYLDRNNIA